jgi:dolichol-phosphate mannosyltransferase
MVPLTVLLRSFAHSLGKISKFGPSSSPATFGHQIAITAGWDYARGDAVVIIDADLQDPPELILEMAKKWREGYEVVYAVRAEREGESWFKLWTASLFYRLIYRITDVKIPLDTGDFRLMDRKVVDVLKQMRERHRFPRGMSAWVGFKQVGVEYKRAARVAGETKYPFQEDVPSGDQCCHKFFLFPSASGNIFWIYLSRCCGTLHSGRSLHAHYWLASLLWSGHYVDCGAFPGGRAVDLTWRTGEYIGRLYDEAKGRPLYIIREAPEN